MLWSCHPFVFPSSSSYNSNNSNNSKQTKTTALYQKSHPQFQRVLILDSYTSTITHPSSWSSTPFFESYTRHLWFTLKQHQQYPIMSPIIARAAIRATRAAGQTRQFGVMQTMRNVARSFEPHPFQRLPVTSKPQPADWSKLVKRSVHQAVM